MSSPIGESPIYWKESRELWACDINLGRRPNGKPHRIQITSKSRNKLIDKRRALIREIEDGTFTSGKVPTVSAWWDYWIENIARPRVVPRVLANYRSYGRKHISQHLGKRKLNKLSVDDVRFLHAEMAKGGASSRTIQAVHKTLSKCLKDAVREGVVGFNICDRMDVPRAHGEERGAFSVAEVRSILRVAEGLGPKEHSKWLTALTVGTRQAERLGLEWDRVDLKSGFIDLSWQIQSIPWAHGAGCGCKPERQAASCVRRRPDAEESFELRPCYLGRWFVRPKTESSRRMSVLPEPLLDALREWREVAPLNSLGLVWPDGRGNPVWGRDDRKEFKELCLSAGVRPRDVHSARHSMVTILLELGVDSEVIRQIAGHSSVLATRNYMHVSTGQARDAMGLLSKHLK